VSGTGAESHAAKSMKAWQDGRAKSLENPSVRSDESLAISMMTYKRHGQKGESRSCDVSRICGGGFEGEQYSDAEHYPASQVPRWVERKVLENDDPLLGPIPWEDYVRRRSVNKSSLCIVAAFANNASRSSFTSM
jgi:hypothetical protein